MQMRFRSRTHGAPRLIPKPGGLSGGFDDGMPVSSSETNLPPSWACAQCRCKGDSMTHGPIVGTSRSQGLTIFNHLSLKSALGTLGNWPADPSFLFLCAINFLYSSNRRRICFEAIFVIGANRVLGVRKPVEVGTSIVKRD